MLSLCRSLAQYQHTLKVQVWVDLKTTVATTRLGYLWWILDPLFLMAIYYFVVKQVFHRGGEDYHLFLLCGIVVWQSFNRSVMLGTTAFTRNRSLILQTSIPLPIYVLTPALVNAFFCFLGESLVIFGKYNLVGIHLVALPFLLLLLILTAFSFSLFFSIIDVYLRDTNKFVSYGLRCAFYISPILYSADKVMASAGMNNFFKVIFALNPMVPLLEGFRDILFFGRWPDWQQLGILGVACLVTIQIGLLWLQRCRNIIPKML